MKPALRRALITRTDLLEEECRIVRARRQTWAGRLYDLGDDFGRSGGSSLDRRLIVEAMTSLELEDSCTRGGE